MSLVNAFNLIIFPKVIALSEGVGKLIIANERVVIFLCLEYYRVEWVFIFSDNFCIF